jgi:hypothetical protein
MRFPDAAASNSLGHVRTELGGHWFTAVLAMLSVTAVGAAVAISPSLALLGIGAVAGAIALTSSSARFAIVGIGALFVLGSSSELDVPKLVFLAWVAVSVLLAAVHRPADAADMASHRGQLSWASLGLLAAIAVSMTLATARGTPFIDSLRDAAPYGLLAVAPLLAVDVGQSRIGRHMEAAIAIAGFLGSVGFAAVFLEKRGIADLPATLGSGSLMLAALLFSVAMGALLSGSSRRLLWAALGAVVLALLFATGTRSTLVLLVGPAVMVMAGGGRSMRFVRLAGASVLVGLVALTLLALAGQSSVIDIARLTDRIASLLSLGTGLADDQSYIERAAQVDAAWTAFTNSPAVGVGLGHRFQWAGITGQAVPTFTIDTGLSLVAKFGLVGVALLAAAAWAVRSFWRAKRPGLPDHLRLSAVGFAAISIAVLPLGNPIEDKGFGIAVAMILAWMLAASRTMPRLEAGSPAAAMPTWPSSGMQRPAPDRRAS